MLLEKYRPKTLRDLIGNQGQGRAIFEWLRKWKKGQALFLYGPTGSGKSLCVRLAAKELGFDIVDSHASDYRDKTAFDNMILSTKQNNVFGKKKILLIEDIELLESKKSLYNLINDSSCPVVLIAENPHQSLMKSCTTIKFAKIQEGILLQFLKKIAVKENLKLNEKQLLDVVKSSNGDVRAALIDIEFAAGGNRERAANIFELIKSIFKNEKNAREQIESASLDTIIMWIDENIPEELKTNTEAATAYNYLSKADVVRSRIAGRQSWALQKYITELILRGLAVSRTSRPRLLASYRNPWITKKINEDTLEKIGMAFHVSKKDAVLYLSVVKMLINDAEFRLSMDFDDDDIEFINKV